MYSWYKHETLIGLVTRIEDLPWGLIMPTEAWKVLNKSKKIMAPKTKKKLKTKRLKLPTIQRYYISIKLMQEYR